VTRDSKTWSRPVKGGFYLSLRGASATKQSRSVSEAIKALTAENAEERRGKSGCAIREVLPEAGLSGIHFHQQFLQKQYQLTGKKGMKGVFSVYCESVKGIFTQSTPRRKVGS
jgi:hypothetical protein